MEANDVLTRQNRLGRTAARTSIVILTLGFSLLGFLSLINKHHVCGEHCITFDNAFSIITREIKPRHNLTSETELCCLIFVITLV
jgi:hypothetical protein